MSIRAKLSLMTATLVAAVVFATAAVVTRAERAALEEQSSRRLQELADGATRLAGESVANHDPLMLLSYLMTLQKEHEELAFASVTIGERVSRLGTERDDLLRLTSRVEPKDADGRPLDLVIGFDRAIVQAELDRALGPLRRRTAAIAAGFALLGGLAALLFAKLLTSQLSKLSAAAKAVKEGNLDVAVPAEGGDEVGELAARFNEMTVRLKEHARFREELLHTLTHELNTPLGGLKGYLELWQDGHLPQDGPERAEVLGSMSGAVDRMSRSLGEALSLFRAGSAEAGGKKKIVWVDDLMREACLLFAPVAKAKNITIARPPEGVTKCLFVDDELLRRVIINLISNALKYTPDGGRVSLGLQSDQRGTKFWVSDNGRGIGPEIMPKLFAPFVRDRRAADVAPGTGLGLNIAHRAAEQMGGTITVESKPGQGTTFTVDFPKLMARKQPEAS